MEKTNLYQSGVIGILARARQVNSQIGSYEEHLINAGFEITVRLSNGRIRMSIDLAQDQEVAPSSIDQDKINRVANSFVNNNPQLIITQQIPNTQPVKKSLWKHLLELLGLN